MYDGENHYQLKHPNHTMRAF